MPAHPPALPEIPAATPAPAGVPDAAPPGPAAGLRKAAPSPPPFPVWSPFWPLVLLALVTALPEAVLLGADAGLWGQGWWRLLAYQYGGFWAGLWHGWLPNYAAQPWLMVLSYPLLHAGIGHLAGNLAGLWLIGRDLAPRIGTGRVLALWAAGVAGGALAFGVLATSAAPMVGASGAVFGLAGGWWTADLRGGRAAGRAGTVRRAGAILAVLAAANAAATLLTPGGIAWQAHLGGFLAGAALAAVWRRRAPAVRG